MQLNARGPKIARGRRNTERLHRVRSDQRCEAILASDPETSPSSRRAAWALVMSDALPQLDAGSRSLVSFSGGGLLGTGESGRTFVSRTPRQHMWKKKRRGAHLDLPFGKAF